MLCMVKHTPVRFWLATFGAILMAACAPTRQSSPPGGRPTVSTPPAPGDTVKVEPQTESLFTDPASEREAQDLLIEARNQVAEAETLRALWRVLQGQNEGAIEPSSQDEIQVIKKYYLDTVLPVELQRVMSRYDSAVGDLTEAVNLYLASMEALISGSSTPDAVSWKEIQDLVARFNTRFHDYSSEIGSITQALSRALSGEDSLEVLAGFSRILDDMDWQAREFDRRMQELQSDGGVVLEVGPGSSVDRLTGTLSTFSTKVREAAAAAKALHSNAPEIASSDEALAFVVEFVPILERFQQELEEYQEAVETFQQDIRFAASPADSTALVLGLHRKTQAFADNAVHIASESGTMEAQLETRLKTESTERREAQVEEAIRIWNEKAVPAWGGAEKSKEQQLLDRSLQLYAEAEGAVRECMRLDPHEVDYRKNLCELLLRKAELLREQSLESDQAATLERFLQIEKGDLERYTEASFSHSLNADAAKLFQETIDAWLEVLNQDRGDYWVYYDLGTANLHLGRASQAAVWYQRALRLLMAQGFLNRTYPMNRSEEVEVERAVLLYQKRQAGEEIEPGFDPSAFVTGPVDTTDWAVSEYQLGLSLIDANRGEDAVSAFNRILSLPESSLLEAGLAHGALAEYVDAIRACDYDVRILKLMASAQGLASKGHQDQALDVYATIVDSIGQGIGRLQAMHRMATLEYQDPDLRPQALERLEEVMVGLREIGTNQKVAAELQKLVAEDFGAGCFNSGIESSQQSRKVAHEWFTKSADVEWSGRGNAFGQIALLLSQNYDLGAKACSLAILNKAEPKLQERVWDVWKRLIQSREGASSRFLRVQQEYLRWKNGGGED